MIHTRTELKKTFNTWAQAWETGKFNAAFKKALHLSILGQDEIEGVQNTIDPMLLLGGILHAFRLIILEKVSDFSPY